MIDLVSVFFPGVAQLSSILPSENHVDCTSGSLPLSYILIAVVIHFFTGVKMVIFHFP